MVTIAGCPGVTNERGWVALKCATCFRRTVWKAQESIRCENTTLVPVLKNCPNWLHPKVLDLKS